MTNPVAYTVGRPADLPAIFHRYRSDFGKALRLELSQDSSGVYGMFRYYMGWADRDGKPLSAAQGKALRPTLCLFACEAAGGTVQQAMPAAVAIELIHSFSLIHDDIQDMDETRHHRPTLWAVWGIPRALVAGNVLRIVADMALGKLADEGVSAETAARVVRILTDAYLSMIEGQYLDLSYEGRRDVDAPQYLDMISKKTGALIRCSTTLGAVIGSRDEATVRALKSYGRSLGLVFQIRDDVLGVWGEEETTGKPVGADIRRKKNSFPVVYAMSAAGAKDKRTLERVYSREEPSDGDVSEVLEVMERTGVKEQASVLMSEHCDRAVDALSGLEIEPAILREAEELVHFLLVRQR